MRFFRCQSKSIFPPLNWKEKFQTFKCHDDNKGPVAQPKKTKNKTKTFARTKCAWVVGSMCDFLKFKFTHVIRLRDLNRQFDQRGGKKNPEAKSRRRKTKTNFKRIGQGRPKRIDPIKTIQRTQISQIVIDFILFFFRPFPAFQIVSPEMFSNIKAKSMRGGRGDVEERFPSVSARARTREENTHSLGKKKKVFWQLRMSSMEGHI